jgi:hypothetical protein
MKHYLFLLFVLSSLNASTQNTVGTITNSNDAYQGYTLFAPFTSQETYLIDNCGRVVHQWTSLYTPGASCYLLENGNLLRTGKIANASITFGGVGGIIQLFSWDNTLLWEYTYSSSQFTQHHDIFPLPNGNVLMLAATTITETEAILAGRDPSLILDGKLYNEQIVELRPIGTNQADIVWEWNIKDHLIQDFDATKANFGIVKDNPELLDFNFLNADLGYANWLHCNSLQYNANLDQILLSSRLLDEIYIIDHSTTTSQASSHSGGTNGKGGDFLYRWGNPEAYDMGDSTNRTLYSQHYPHWIPDGLIDAGKILIFNNGNSIRFSAVDIISPPTTSPGVYSYDSVNGYGPTSPDWSYIAPNPSDFFSAVVSSAQRLPNGNMLICDGDSGYFFEIDASNKIVWEYINPDTANGIISQGETTIANIVFRAFKHPLSYAAFNGRDLSPGDPIELNPDISNCSLLNTPDNSLSEIKIYPNPTNNILNIKTNEIIDKIEVFTILGHLVIKKLNSKSINLVNLSKGLYILKIHSKGTFINEKIIKK